MDLASLQIEYDALIFAEFTETTALTLGPALVEMAQRDNLPVVINIRTANRTYFHAALPRSAPLNDTWARRKSNTALLFQEPTLLIAARLKEKGETLARHGLSSDDYAENGGAVPIRVRGAGVVAVVTVSGLPQVEDHKLVVRGLKALLQP